MPPTQNKQRVGENPFNVVLMDAGGMLGLTQQRVSSYWYHAIWGWGWEDSPYWGILYHEILGTGGNLLDQQIAS